jgi:hypothetical protein
MNKNFLVIIVGLLIASSVILISNPVLAAPLTMFFSETEEFSNARVIVKDSTSVESFSDNTKVILSSATNVGYTLPISETITKNSTKWNPVIPQNIESYKEYFIDTKKILQLTNNNQPMSMNLDSGNPYSIHLEEYSLVSPDVWNRVTVNGTVIDLPIPDIHTYRGYVMGEETTSDVRFTISGNWVSAQIQTSQDTFYIDTLSSKSDSDKYYSYKKSDTSYSPINDEVIDVSGIDKHPLSEIKLNEIPLIQYADGQTVKTALIILDCDMEYNNINPSTIDSRRLAVLNDISPVYANLGIQFVVVGFSCDLTNSELTSTNSNNLLDQLQDRWKFNSGQRHIVHLFSGKDLESGTAGIAFQPGINHPLDFGYSLSQNVPDIINGFFASSSQLRDNLAHEIGHNFDGVHVEQGKCVFVSSLCIQHDTIMRTGDLTQGVGFDNPLIPNTFDFSDGSLNVNRNNKLRISNMAQSSLINLTPISCITPTSGNWVLHFSCILTQSYTAPGDVILDTPAFSNSNVSVTINPSVTLNLDFVNHKLLIKSGNALLIKSGATVT